MLNDIAPVRVGLILSMLTLLFGIGMGVIFGVNEDAVKGYVKEGIAAHSQLHDSTSESKIWRYAQRAHFHATGVGAFALAMILVAGSTSMSRPWKAVSSTLIGIGSFYSMAWLSMFLLAPTLGRSAAHHALVTEAVTKVTVGSLLIGIGILFLYLLFGEGRKRSDDAVTA